MIYVTLSKKLNVSFSIFLSFFSLFFFLSFNIFEFLLSIGNNNIANENAALSWLSTRY